MRVSIIPLIVRKLRKALAIVQDTNTATRNIDAGKFVMWKGELCKALSAITTGDTLSSTNLEACTDGGLNALNSKTWTLIGTATGSTPVNFDASLYEELFITVQVFSDNTTPGLAIGQIPTAILSPNEKHIMLTGGYQHGTYGKCCYINITNDHVNAYYVYNDQTAVLSNASITVYGK